MSTNAFTPQGNTVTFTAAASAPTPVQAVANGSLGCNQYRIINAGTTIVFLGVGTTSALATANAATVTSSGASIALLPGTDEILTFAPNAYFTGVSSANAVVYIVPGDGI